MMRTFVPLLGLCFLLSGCAAPPKGAVFQTSTIDALLIGAYDGELSCRRLLRYGDLGIGTFDGLDGEMVLLDGIVYQIKADGNVYRPDLSLRTPFATTCFFKPKTTFAIGAGAGANVEELERLIDRAAPNRNLFCAIKVTGRFK
jgi:acetolactate decarboxylase